MPVIPFTENVIPRLLEWRQAGIACAMVTLVGVDGSAPRRIGSQMAVNANGCHLGTISSGCAEAAIIAEAAAAITSGVSRTVRYGAGSRYMDVVLPCGSGIDVHFDPAIETAALRDVQAAVMARLPARLEIPLAWDPLASGLRAWDTKAWDPLAGQQTFVRHYHPAPRIIIAGRGVGVDYVAAFAHHLEWDVVVASPDEATLARVTPFAGMTRHLTTADDFDPSVIDAHSAVVLLFHDHDWEPPILKQCESKRPFYVGALGSRRTHARRKQLLEMLGCAHGFIASIRSPAGLVIGAMNPPEIALAIIAEILPAAIAVRGSFYA